MSDHKTVECARFNPGATVASSPQITPLETLQCRTKYQLLHEDV